MLFVPIKSLKRFSNTLGVFFFEKYVSGLGSTNLKKTARCQLFLAFVRCLFHNHLWLKRSSLLNVYLKYKFEISLLTSHLFFSWFSLYKIHCSRANLFMSEKGSSILGMKTPLLTSNRTQL